MFYRQQPTRLPASHVNRILCAAGMFRFMIGYVIMLGVFVSRVDLNAQPEPTQNLNQVLTLDGDGDYVTLPTNAFQGLDEVTVEVWVKWTAFRNYSRVFEFGQYTNSIKLMIFEDYPVLRYDIDTEHFLERESSDPRRSIGVNNFLPLNQWVHLAAVSGNQGMKLYANGVLVGSFPTVASMNVIDVFEANSIGRGLWQAPNDEDFQGQMDEFRVWDHQRTAEQIHRSMFDRLSGNEVGLVGLWNFDAGNAADAGPRGLHGEFHGDAHTQHDVTRSKNALAKPVVFRGKVIGEDGVPVKGTTVQLYGLDRKLQNTELTTDDNGHFILTTLRYSDSDKVDVKVKSGSQASWIFENSFSSGEEVLHELYLTGANLKGSVVDYAGDPISNVLIQLFKIEDIHEVGGESNRRLVDYTVTSSERGANFRFPTLPAGDYQLMAHHPEGLIEFNNGEVIHIEPGQVFHADFEMTPFRKGVWRRYSTADSLPHNIISDQDWSDADATLWVGTISGLAQFGGSDTRVISQQNGLLDNNVWAVRHSTKENVLWLGTSRGVHRLDTDSGRIDAFPAGQDGLSDGVVVDISEGADGVIWVRTLSGLSRFDHGVFTQVKGMKPSADSSMQVIAIDDHGVVWTGSSRGGLLKVENMQMV